MHAAPVVTGSAATWDMDAHVNFSGTENYLADQLALTSAASVNFESQEVLRFDLSASADYTNAEDILSDVTRTRCVAILDLDKANYLTLAMEMTTDGDFSATEDMGCIKMGMVAKDPMSMPMDINMSMAVSEPF